MGQPGGATLCSVEPVQFCWCGSGSIDRSIHHCQSIELTRSHLSCGGPQENRACERTEPRDRVIVESSRRLNGLPISTSTSAATKDQIQGPRRPISGPKWGSTPCRARPLATIRRKSIESIYMIHGDNVIWAPGRESRGGMIWMISAKAQYGNHFYFICFI